MEPKRLPGLRNPAQNLRHLSPFHVSLSLQRLKVSRYHPPVSGELGSTTMHPALLAEGSQSSRNTRKPQAVPDQQNQTSS